MYFDKILKARLRSVKEDREKKPDPWATRGSRATRRNEHRRSAFAAAQRTWLRFRAMRALTRMSSLMNVRRLVSVSPPSLLGALEFTLQRAHLGRWRRRDLVPTLRVGNALA